jgi:hypothetical protein
MIKTTLGDLVIRFIGRVGLQGNRTQTFHEVLISLLTSVLENPWYDQQLAKRPEDRHIIMQWIGAWCDESQRAVPLNHQAGTRYEFTRTGQAQELLALAYDIYCLLEADRLDWGVRDRLKTDDQFQGARYELAVAAIFVRNGFDLSWINQSKGPGKRCEFVASHRVTGEVIAVEAKSRHRPGTLQQPGPPPDLVSLHGDVRRLYFKAIAKDPKDKPFAIFIDANLPHQPQLKHLDKTWVPEIFDMVTDHLTSLRPMPAPFSALFVTNYAWHYEGRNIPNAGEHIFICPKYTTHPWTEQSTFDAIGNGLLRYGVVPDYEDAAFCLHQGG